MTIIILFCFLSLKLSAPPDAKFYVAKSEVIAPYEAIIRAVTTVESANGKYLFNAKENAVGWFGIRPIRLRDYNKQTGKSYTLADCYDYEIAKSIFLFYATQFNPDDIKGICVSWNGKSLYNRYYQKIKKVL
jgi:hypothetical protein